MMDFRIRECRIQDAAYIQELSRNGLGYDFSLEDTARKLAVLLQSDKDKIYVAVAEGKVVGYIHAVDYDVLYAPHMKNIMGLAVASDYKRNGIGTALLQQIEIWAKENGAKGIRLNSGEARTDAHVFYAHRGYENKKLQRNFQKWFD